MDIRMQWRAARQGTAVADLSTWRSRIVVSGRDRRRFLHGLTSNDIQGLAPGERRQATLLNPQGKVIAAFHVYDRGDDFLLESAGAAGARLSTVLDRYVIADDVQVTLAPPDALPAWAALGPGAAALVRDALGDSTAGEGLQGDRVMKAGPDGRVLVASAQAVLGAEGILVLGAPVPVGPDAAGAEIPRLDDAVLELLRIEGGVPGPGHEIDEKLLPQEAALDAALSFTKGCYVGQEAVAMLHYRGKLRRKLLGLVLGATDTEGAAGDGVFLGAEDVGRITSGPVASPAFEGRIALAILKLPVHEPGTRVELERDGRRIPATVHALPLVA